MCRVIKQSRWWCETFCLPLVVPRLNADRAEADSNLTDLIKGVASLVIGARVMNGWDVGWAVP